MTSLSAVHFGIRFSYASSDKQQVAGRSYSRPDVTSLSVAAVPCPVEQDVDRPVVL